MASGIKLDAKNERIVRGLMKLPENRKCINCMKMVHLMFFKFLLFQINAKKYFII